jgi:hypothetical protein
MFSAAEAFGASAAAEGGFDVPSNMSPVTQLHPSEMVLPATLADTVRAGVTNGANGGQPSINPVIHFSISTLDQRSIARWVNQNGPAFANMIRTQVNRFNPALRTPTS